MTLSDAVKTCFRKYITFSGRAARAEFWKFILFCILVSLVLIVVNSALFGPTVEEGVRFSVNADGTQSTEAYRSVQYTGGWLGSLFSLIVILPTLAAAWRRLHDTGRSGWWVLASYGLLAVTGALWFLTSTAVDVGTDPTTGEVISVLMPSSFAVIVIPGLLSIAMAVVVLFWLSKRSSPEENRFGPAPDGIGT